MSSYERATIRDIGERAGVDPALIARYFGGKEGLFLAVLGDPARLTPIPPEQQTFADVARVRNGLLDELATASVEDLLALVEPMLATLADA